jgi:hypothetical protein
MQLSTTVEVMDITVANSPGSQAGAAHLTVKDREYTLEAGPRESLLDVLCQRFDPGRHEEGVPSVKGLRELPATSVAPAIANAVHHAPDGGSVTCRSAPRCSSEPALAP